MKKTTLIFLLALFVFSFGAQATDVTAHVTGNTTWSLAGSPYIVKNNIEVRDNATLTIEPGVEVKFDKDRLIRVYGTLNATGVTFTANAGLTPGFWNGIAVSYNSTGTNYAYGDVNLNNCTIEYGQNLYAEKGTLSLTGSTLENMSGGVKLYKMGTLNINDTKINNSAYPIEFVGPGVINAGDDLMFEENTVNDIKLNFGNVDQDWTIPNFGKKYYVQSNLNVVSGATITIEPGVNFEFIRDRRLTITSGALKAIGTAEKPIVFDKIVDADYWDGLLFQGNAFEAETMLKYCVIKNARYNGNENYPACRLINASIIIDNCIFSDNAYNLIIEGKSDPVISNSTFKGSVIENEEARNILMDANSRPTFTINSIEFNDKELRALKLRAANVTRKDARLEKVDFIEFENITYCLYGRTTVLDTAKLVIDPGVVIKWRNYIAELQGNGQIEAIGTDDEPVVFTALGDDEHGNPKDTQNDGTKVVNASSGGRIYLYSEEESRLEKCEILYGGYSSAYWPVYLSKSNVVNECEIKHSHKGIRFSDNARITNNLFDEIINFPVSYLISQGVPILSGNQLSEIGYLGINIVGPVTDETVVLKKMNFGGIENIPYVINDQLVVNTGSTLNIEPGVIVKSLFYSVYSLSILVEGALKATGSQYEKIIFTSIHDDSVGGDTNNNGTSTVPQKNDWSGIGFSKNSRGSENILENCEFHYAGRGRLDGTNTWGSVSVSSSKVLINSVLINYSYTNGIQLLGDADPEIMNCDFKNIDEAPILMQPTAKPLFGENIKMSNVGWEAIFLFPTTLTEDCTIGPRSFAGYDNITYIFRETMTSNESLTFEPGVVVKGYGRWNVNGKLNILGTEEKPVVFTAIDDDEYGNPKDTRQNGPTSPGQDGGYFHLGKNSSDESIINNAVFRYSYASPINIDNKSPTIQNCRFEESAKSGITLTGTSTPVVKNSVFHNIAYPVSISAVNFPSVEQSNTISGTTARAIRLNDETLNVDATLSKRSFAGLNDLPYAAYSYTVGTSAQLLIEPGVVIKFENGGSFYVRNSLKAIGGNGPDDLIVFTSLHDDFYGGDTRNDGNAIQPGIASWSGMYFYNESVDEDCILENVVIKHASYSNTWGGVTLDNASPKLKNIRFDSSRYGIIANGSSFPSIENCDFTATDVSGGYAIWNKNNSTVVTATNCWFDSNSGPRHNSNPEGKGGRVSDNVAFTPFAGSLMLVEMGDVSLNGTISSYDASLVMQQAAGNIQLSNKQKGVADVSRDGQISSFDASLILKYNVNLLTTFAPDYVPLRWLAPTSAHDVLRFGKTDMLEEGKLLRVPVLINTGAGISSIDLHFNLNNDELLVERIERENIPGGISFVCSENLSSSEIRVSMASAYDLGLKDGVIYLYMRFKDENTASSELNISYALLNESELAVDDLSSLQIINYLPTGLNNPESDKISIRTTGDHIIIEFDKYLKSQAISVGVADLSGRWIYQEHKKSFDGTGISIPLKDISNMKNGVYLVQIITGERKYSGKLIISKRY